MPLVVSSLTGDASDVFDWTCSISPGDAQDLSELLQMLRNITVVPSCFGSRGTWSRTYIKGASEDATDFMIRVGSSVGNLAKD